MASIGGGSSWTSEADRKKVKRAATNTEALVDQAQRLAALAHEVMARPASYEHFEDVVAQVNRVRQNHAILLDNAHLLENEQVAPATRICSANARIASTPECQRLSEALYKVYETNLVLKEAMTTLSFIPSTTGFFSRIYYRFFSYLANKKSK